MKISDVSILSKISWYLRTLYDNDNVVHNFCKIFLYRKSVWPYVELLTFSRGWRSVCIRARAVFFFFLYYLSRNVKNFLFLAFAFNHSDKLIRSPLVPRYIHAYFPRVQKTVRTDHVISLQHYPLFSGNLCPFVPPCPVYDLDKWSAIISFPVLWPLGSSG